jgi:hypothetical protein
MNRTNNEGHDQHRTPPRGIPHSIRPNVPCPEIVLVVVMSHGNYLLATRHCKKS